MTLAAVRRCISENEITPRISYVELSSSELAPVDDDALTESGERLTVRPAPIARAPRPDPGAKRARRERRLRTVTSLAVFVALGVVLYVERESAMVTRFAASLLDMSPPPRAAVVAAFGSPPAVGCALVGTPQKIARRALASSGIAIVVDESRVALGFASSPVEGMAMELDLPLLSTHALAKVTTTRPLRRLVPLLAPGGGLDALAEGDTQGLPAALQKLDGRAPIDAVRSAPVDDGKVLAVTYRRDATIWAAALTAGSPRALDGPPLPISEPRMLVGRPALAVVGDAVVVAWASRTSTTQPWSVRWTRWNVARGFVEASRLLAIPPGGAGGATMSPSIAALGRESFVVAWTEGTTTHRVRAQTYGLDGARIGEPFAISPSGADAGQGEVAVAAGGRGLVAFLVKGDTGEMELFATPLSCN